MKSKANDLKDIETLFESSKYLDACKALDGLIQRLRNLENREDLPDALRLYGKTLRQLGRFHEALSALGEASLIYKDLGNTSLYGHTMAEHGSVLIDVGDPAAAVGLFQAALKAHRSMADRVEEGLDLLNLGVAVYRGPDLGVVRHGGKFSNDYIPAKTARAIQLWTDAVKILLETQHIDSFTALSNMASVFRTLGCYRDAIECHYKALDFAQKLGLRSIEASILTHLATDISIFPQTPYKWWEVRIKDQSTPRDPFPVYFTNRGEFPKGYLDWSEDQLDQEVFSRVIALSDPPQLGLRFFDYIREQEKAEAIAVVYWLNALSIYNTLSSTENISVIVEQLRSLYDRWGGKLTPELRLIVPRIQEALRA